MDPNPQPVVTRNTVLTSATLYLLNYIGWQILNKKEHFDGECNTILSAYTPVLCIGTWDSNALTHRFHLYNTNSGNSSSGSTMFRLVGTCVCGGGGRLSSAPTISLSAKVFLCQFNAYMIPSIQDKFVISVSSLSYIVSNNLSRV